MHGDSQVSRQPIWVCCQIGAREHYSFPRMLHAEGLLGALITDAWVQPSSLIGSIRLKRLQRLQERYHVELASANVIGFTLSLLYFELCKRLCKSTGWSLTLARNLWFQSKTVAVLRRLAPQLEKGGQRPILFAYSYSSLELIRFAKQRGWRVVLSQIDGGRQDEKLMSAAHRCLPDSGSFWPPVPNEYWVRWEQECALADHIIVNSEWSRQLLLDAGIEAPKLRVIPVAYEVGNDARRWERCYPLQFNAKRPLRILFLGSFTLRKGAMAVLDAIRILKNEPVEFWIVGMVGVKVPSVLRSSPKVKWIGPVSRDATSEYYRHADLFLFPTLSDGFGMTQVEAQEWKLPIIATPFCATIVQHDRNGLVIANATGTLITDAIRILLYNIQMLQRFSDAAASDGEAYSLERVRECYFKLISGVCSW